MKVRTYYRLTKPGIIYGNIMTTMAAFLFACAWHIDWVLLVSAAVGTSLVIGGACVFNNYIDRDIDAKMERTRKRALVAGNVSSRAAIIYGSVLSILGYAMLALGTNWLTAFIGLLGMVFYVLVYGWGKRNSIYGTLIGSISGSMPIVAGYTAATNQFDGAALLLFVIMAVWQLPHFYAIAIYRYKDYQAAGLPVWPVVKGIAATKRQIMGCIVVYCVAVLLLAIYGYAGVTFAVVCAAIGLYWLWRGWQSYKTMEDAAWGRRMFGTSLLVLLVFSGTLALGSILP